MVMSKNNSSSKSKYDFVTPVIALLVLIALGYGAQYWYDNIRTPSSYNVCLESYNYTDKRITSFYVNDLWGGNVAAKQGLYPYGSGGGACTGSVSGKTATIRWEFEMEKAEDYKNHVKPETHEVTVPMPIAESNHSSNLQVRFFSDNHVELQLTNDMRTFRNKEEEILVTKLLKAEIDAVANKEQAQKDSDIAKAKKFDEENEAAYLRYKAEHDKQHSIQSKEQK